MLSITLERTGRDMKRASMRISRVSIIVISLFLLCTAGIFFLRNRHGLLNEQESYKTVILFGNDNAVDREILKERLQAAAGKDGYQLGEKDGYLQLGLKESLFGNNQVSQFLEYFLTEPVRITLLRQKNGETYPDFNDYVCELQQGDITRSEYGRKENQPVLSSFEECAESEIPVLDFSIPENMYLKLTFSDKTAAKARKVLETGDQLILCCDWISSYKTNRHIGLLYDILAPDEDDPASFYLHYSEDSILAGNEEIFLYNLSHSSITSAYSYVIADEIQWDNVHTSGVSGEYLEDEQEIREEYYIMQYSSEKSLTNHEMLQMKQFLSTRLDALKCPHAIGETREGTLCVKAKAANLSREIARSLLLETRPVLQVWTEWYMPSYSTCSFSYDQLAIELAMDSETSAWVRERIRNGTSSGSKVFLLFGNGISGEALLAAGMKVPVSFTGDELVFRMTSFSDEKQTAEGLPFILRFFEELYLNPDPPVSMVLDYYVYEGKEYLSDDHFGLDDIKVRQENELEAVVQKVCPGAELKTEYGYQENTLTISLNMTIDDEMPEKFISMVSQIYHTIDFEQQSYTVMYILPRDTSADGTEGLYFRKGIESVKHTIGFAAQIQDASFEGYGREILECLRKNKFYSGFADLNTMLENGMTIPR